ncbi:MAG: 2-C-methyl-D-erythritol 4-phosphate cytidylyltransferase [Clostridia bacterium]|nr:2-C-methyl-D-erythritol 4-phosphate cytidylyltransferase [Clostridia bacterium]
MYKNLRVAAVVLVAGTGSRMGAEVPKQFLKIDGQAMMVKTIKKFLDNPYVDQIVCVVNPDFEKESVELVKEGTTAEEWSKLAFVPGGEERTDSVYNALADLEGKCDYVLIHDGARPFVHQETINECLDTVYKNNSAICCVPVKDTIRKKTVTLNRSELYQVQTPQAFNYNLIYDCYKKANRDSFKGTDDASVAEHYGYELDICAGTYDNIKITTKEDLKVETRVGTGFDVHQLVEGRDLILGGVKIGYEKGLLGHSDADVLLHAIMDALLGAAGLGDIGKHFPDSDDKYKGISSIKLLEHVAGLLKENGFTVGNIDGTLIAQAPKISPYVGEMVTNIAKALNIDEKQVNIKGTTTEKLGFTGRGEGIAAEAVALINC